ncbi:toxin-antitoxin system HicB family antitoxin [Phycicoccus sp. HDW14]|uniref:toxin-antitoxin system HicB family antitoxin n=1 Tax=Phycicoccus sp. HDW14 TaxID=2714941 RepID=UPI00140ACF60|nr:toxin-antitoxin system HicB family antitoxin [Phycicoccus sp. HDW14]QIM22062.1 toxin-antitoxin system HicB family antitoxin [Phycicoccus sp. HDW14]
MDLTPYVARLQRDLVTTARTGGPEAVELAELLAGGVEPSARMLLLDAVVEAAAEVTERLTPGTVDVRLRGRELDLVVTSPALEAPIAPPTADAGPDADDDETGGTARLSLRLPERLKPRLEEAAEASGLSVNAWLVRTVAAAVADPRTHATTPSAPTITAPIRTGQRQTGWVR